MNSKLTGEGAAADDDDDVKKKALGYLSENFFKKSTRTIGQRKGINKQFGFD